MNKNQKLNRIEEGIARNVNWERVVQSSTDRTDILSFTIEQTDHQGNPVQYIPVYCEAKQIKGVLVDGDPVRVSGKMSKGGTLLPEEIFNIRTQASVEFTTTMGCSNFIINTIVFFICIVMFIQLVQLIARLASL